MIKVLKPVMCWFLILSVGKKRKQALWWQKIVTFAPPPKLFCLYNHTPLFFCFQLCFTQILAGVSRKSEIADPFYWAANAAFLSFSLATKKETKMAARFYVNNFTIRFFFSHPLFISMIRFPNIWFPFDIFYRFLFLYIFPWNLIWR